MHLSAPAEFDLAHSTYPNEVVTFLSANDAMISNSTLGKRDNVFYKFI